MKNYKFSELQSTSSTLESVVGTPQSILTLTSLGTKKFARKRDSSTQSLRKSGTANTPKSNNNSMTQKQEMAKKSDKIEDLNFNKIIKSNSYIKWFQSPTSRKTSQISEPSSARQQNTLNIQNLNSLKQKTQAIQQYQNNFETPKNKQYIRTNQKSFQNFRVLNSASNAIRSRKQLDPQQGAYNLSNYSEPQTERELYSGVQKTDSTVQIKVLQNEIMILEDENARLKKQIAQLNSQKDQQVKKKLQIQNQLKQVQKKIYQLQNSQFQTIKIIKDQMHQIYLQILENYKSNINQNEITEKQRKLFSSEPQSPIKSKQMNKIKNSQYLNLNEFVKDFMEPAKQIIYQNIRKYGKILENQKVNFNKLQIRQNIMMRGSFELQSVKNQNKLLNEQVKTERDRSKKFKDECQKLRKQNVQIKKNSTGYKNRSTSQILTNHEKSRNSTGSQEFVSLILSDGSDDECNNSHPRKSKK